MFKLRFVATEPHTPAALVIRPYANGRDRDAMQRILAACAAATTLEAELSDIPTEGLLLAAPNWPDQVRIAELNGEVVGFGWVRWWPQPDGSWLYYHRAYIPPEMRGQGIGSQMLAHIEALLADEAAWHSPRTPRYFGADIATGGRDTSRLLTTFGYRPLATIAEMALDERLRLPTAYLPAGYALRAAHPSDSRELWGLKTAGWQRPETGLDFRAFAQTIDPAYDRAAWHGEQLAAATLADLSGGVGRITDVLCHPAYTGHGLERGLLLHTIHALREAGAAEVRLYAGARATLYETIGFREVGTYTRYIKPMAS